MISMIKYDAVSSLSRALGGGGRANPGVSLHLSSLQAEFRAGDYPRGIRSRLYGEKLRQRKENGRDLL